MYCEVDLARIELKELKAKFHRAEIVDAKGKFVCWLYDKLETKEKFEELEKFIAEYDADFEEARGDYMYDEWKDRQMEERWEAEDSDYNLSICDK